MGAAVAALAAGGLTMTDRALAVEPGVVTSTLDVTGTSGVISDVNLKTQITHGFARDLEIFLTSPGGTTVAISTRSPAAGVPNNNIFSDATWDDQADDPVTDKADFVDNGGAVSLTPEAALGAFVGEDPDGTWTLTVRDVDPIISGTLNGWGLDLRTVSPPAPTTEIPFDAAPGTAIPDNTPAGITSDIMVAAGDSIWDADLVTGIDHPAGIDLTVRLTSPAGTTALITSGNGFFNNAFNGVTFDDDAGSPTTRPVSDDPFNLPLPTSLVPEGAMAQFKGENPDGVWTLSVVDGLPQDTGTLASWGLRLKTLGASPAETLFPRTSTDPPKAIPDATDPPPPGPGPGPGTPPPGGGTPPTTAPPVTPPVAVAKLKPRGLGISLNTRRDRRAPFRFRVTGRFNPPTQAAICAGRVRVTMKAGRRVVAKKTVRLRRKGSRCIYRATFSLKRKPRSLPRSGKVVVSARFLGTSRLTARNSKRVRVRIG